MNKLFKAFLAVMPKEIRRVVIISPIIYPKQFEKTYGKRGKHYKSILRYLVVNFKDMTFIKTPMTQSAVYDAVLMLKKTACRQINFVGAIGGIEKGLRIGDIVISDRAKDVCSLKSIHEETRKNLLTFRKNKILGIDFEARDFFRAAKKTKLKGEAFYVVTDLPLRKPFYIKKTKKEQARIKEAVSKIVANLGKKEN